MDVEVKSMREALLGKNLTRLVEQLKAEGGLNRRIEILERFLGGKKKLPSKNLEATVRVIHLSLQAIGQESLVNRGIDITGLGAIEEFYREIGGIVGYHVTCIELLAQKDIKEKKGSYYPPESIDISTESPLVKTAILSGIRHLDSLAEIYPIGGAADRLSLKNEETGEFQSAAPLYFCGRSLIERLIDDLQAKEYLHYKLFKKQVRVPVVMMTSNEKHNDAHVKKLFREHNWFGRREEDFFLFSQPLVPAMNLKGKWCITEPTRLYLKPGGHGVIWKLAQDHGALNWLEKKGKKKAFVRQINNLIAGVDYGLLAFLGIGFDRNMQFGFAGCPRAKGLSEGVNVVIENDKKYCLTNIEYCDVEHFEVDEEEPLVANTNLLFVDLSTLPTLIEQNPIPGMLVNIKKMMVPDQAGGYAEEEILRLESTMQNLADSLFEESRELQKSYITSNRRKKTISTLKKEFAFGSSLAQTPEQVFLDLLENGADLLTHVCEMEVPLLRDPSTFFQYGPSFIFTYHPSLGPLYSIIKEKIQGGRLVMGSELRLGIADIYLENLDVDGSLSIHTDAIMGHFDEGIVYSNQTGKCVLKNVQIRNSGINREATRSYWKDEIIHKEKCEIYIEEGGEFHAEDIVLRGDIRIRIPSGVRIEAKMVDGHLTYTEVVLKKPSWEWEYFIDSQDQITCTLKQ